MDKPVETQLTLELNGADIHPDNAPTRVILELALHFFHGVEAFSRKLGKPVDLVSLEIIDECLQFRSKARADDPKATTLAIGELMREVARAEPNQHGSLVGKLRYSMESLPPDVEAFIKLDKRPAMKIELSPPSDRPRMERTSLRATVLRVGGRKPTVMFESRSEDGSFVLGADKSDLQAIASSLYRDVDISVRIERDEEGRIVGGRLLSFSPVPADNPLDAWATWFEENDEPWKGVKDIVAELDKK